MDEKLKSLIDIIDDTLQSIFSTMECDVVESGIIEYCHQHKQEIAMFIVEREP